MLAFLAASPVFAQDAATPPPTAPVAGFQDGFFIQSANGDNRLVFGLVAQLDGRFSVDDPPPIVSTFTVRKFRPTLTGRVGRYFDFKAMPDFGSGTTSVQDAYIDIRFSPKLRVRTGKDKTPVGYELLQGDANVFFPERSLASSLVPNRDIGIQVQGDLSPRLFYAAGVFNGVPDGSSSSTELDTNGSKDFAGRIVVQPFRTATNPGPMNGFGFQIGGTAGTEAGALPSFKTSVQQNYFSYAVGVAASGSRRRVAPAVFYYYRSFGGFAEYVRSTQRVGKASTLADVTNQAWDITGSFLVTGETATYGTVRPVNTFDPEHGHWGALQVLARYSVLSVDRGAFDLGLAAANASRQAKQFTIAVNWFPVSYIKYYFTFERTTFDRVRSAENVIVVRAQLGF